MGGDAHPLHPSPPLPLDPALDTFQHNITNTDFGLSKQETLLNKAIADSIHGLSTIVHLIPPANLGTPKERIVLTITLSSLGPSSVVLDY